MQSFVASFVQGCGAPARDNDRAQAPDMQLRAGAGLPARIPATKSLIMHWPRLLPSPALIAAGNFQQLLQLPRLYRPFHPFVVKRLETPDNFASATRSACECLATHLACCA